jgi:peptidoglycan hydrolase-like protein with peptidoglycan-binding domain
LGTCGPMVPGWSINEGMASQDPCVGALQDSLAAVGFGGLDVDGLYGVATWSAVWRFQSAHQLNATGDADAQTIGLLDQVANSPAAMSPDNGESLQAPPAPDFTVTVNGDSYVDVEPATDTPDDSGSDDVP